MSDIEMHFLSATEWRPDLPKPLACFACGAPTDGAQVMVLVDAPDPSQYAHGLICRDCQGTEAEMRDRILDEIDRIQAGKS